MFRSRGSESYQFNLLKRFGSWLFSFSALLCCEIIFLCLTGIPASAQTPGPVQLSLSKNEVDATNEDLVDITLKIINHSPTAVNMSLTMVSEPSLELVSKDHSAFICQPGDSLFVPVKIFVTSKAQAGKDHVVDFLLHDLQGNLLDRQSLHLKVELKRNVVLIAQISTLLLNGSTDSIRIPVQLVNTGNTPQKIRILGQLPSLFVNESFPATNEFVISPSTDTLIYFNKAVTGAMLTSDGFNVNITGLYADNDIFGMGYVRVQSARSNRRYPIEAVNPRLGVNSISISSQSMFLPYQSYLFSGNGNLPFVKGALNYNYDIRTWKNAYSPTSIRNTYINYSSPNMGATAGNINKNMEIFLSGRGLTAFFADTARHNRYEAGYINENTDILNNNYFSPIAGQAAWGTMNHAGKTWGLNSFAIYQASPLSNSQDMLAGSAFTLTGLHLRMSVNMGAGYTTEYIAGNAHKMSVAGGVDFSGTIKRISFSSSSFLSTGYYPGTRKGAMTFLHRITWTKDRLSVWANMDYYKYDPKVLGVTQFDLPVFSNFHTEGGVSRSVTDHLQLSVATGYSIERNNAYQFTGEARNSQDMKAVKATGTLNYTIGPNHFLSLISENGIYNTSFDPVKRFRLRSTLNYSYGLLNLNSSYQSGFFILGEAANQFRTDAIRFRSVISTATLHKNYFHDKLTTDAGVAFQYNTYSGRNWYLTGRMDYVFLPGTSFYAAVNHTGFGQEYLNIIESGFVYKLRLVPKIGIKSRSINILVYKDLDQNDRYDRTDSLATGYLLLINDVIFITSSQGTIQYKNLPGGDYKIAMLTSNGWYAPEQNFNLETKLRIEVALKKTGTLKGNVAFKYSEFSYEVNRSLGGIAVNATDENGKVFTIRTNSAGNYIMYVPVGNYAVALDTGDFPAIVQVTGIARQIKVAAGSTTVNNYELTVKDKKVEMKKFVSPNH